LSIASFDDALEAYRKLKKAKAFCRRSRDKAEAIGAMKDAGIWSDWMVKFKPLQELPGDLPPQ
jgi:hypothetical protein